VTDSHISITDKIVMIFTFGWSPEFVIRPLLRDGVSENNTLVLISAKPVSELAKKRVSEALEEIKRFLTMSGIRKYDYFEIDVNRDFEEIVRDFARIVNKFKPASKFKFYLTGGMRVLVVAGLIVAGLMSQLNDVNVVLSQEDSPILYKVSPRYLSIDLGQVTEARLEVLKMLKGIGEATFEDLAVGRDEVTVRKHLTKLREIGLVNFYKRGRKQVYKLTPLGYTVLELIG